MGGRKGFILISSPSLQVLGGEPEIIWLRSTAKESGRRQSSKGKGEAKEGAWIKHRLLKTLGGRLPPTRLPNSLAGPNWLVAGVITF